MSLTPRQKELFDIIAEYKAANGGKTPRYKYMTWKMGTVSKSSIFQMIDQLVERGYARRHAKPFQIELTPPKRSPQIAEDVTGIKGGWTHINPLLDDLRTGNLSSPPHLFGEQTGPVPVCFGRRAAS